MQFQNERTRADILEHAYAALPRESCGLILNARGHERYVRCENLAADGQHFVLDPSAYMAAEDRAEISAVVHSHPYAPSKPSQPDLVGCERSALPWLIVSIPNDEFHLFHPSAYVADYIGRQFCYGVLDCYTLWQDWYRKELGIELPERPAEASTPGWWKGPAARELYIEGALAAGFVAVDEAQRGDVFLVQVASNVANHSAIYLGDQVVLHHVWGRLSCRESWGGYWNKNTRLIVRHRSKMEG